MLILKRPWTRQPQTPVGVNWSNPITRGIRLLVIPGVSPNDAVLGLPPVGRTYSISPGPPGMALLGDGSTTTYRFPKNSYSAAGDLSTFSIINTTSLAADQSIITKNGATAIPLNHGVATTGKIFLYRWLSTPNSRYWLSSSLLVAANTLASVGMSVSAAAESTPRFFLNGQVEPGTLNSGALNGAIADPTDADLAVACYSAAGGKLTGQMFITALWGRRLSDAEMLSLYVNPWQLFAPQRIYIPTAAAAATAPSITALSAINITATSAQPRISYS